MGSLVRRRFGGAAGGTVGSAVGGDAVSAVRKAAGGGAGSGVTRVVRGVVVAAMLAVGAVMFVPAPAQAGGDYLQLCLPDGDDDPVSGDCVWFQVFKFEKRKLWPDPDVCPACFPSLDVFKGYIDPVVRGEFNGYFGKGFGYLADAALTQDVKEAAQLREDAAEMFLAAAEAVGKYEVSFERAGWVDTDTGKAFEHAVPQQSVEAGTAIAEAFTLLEKALHDPQPEVNVEAALGRLDHAVEQFNALAVS